VNRGRFLDRVHHVFACHVRVAGGHGDLRRGRQGDPVERDESVANYVLSLSCKAFNPKLGVADGTSSQKRSLKSDHDHRFN
jgi:hypothetical protein